MIPWVFLIFFPFGSLFSSDTFLLLVEIFISTKSKGTSSIVATGFTGCPVVLRVFTILRVCSLEFNCIFLNLISLFGDGITLAKKFNLKN